MKRFGMLGLLVLCSCDWEAAERQARCTRGLCDAGTVDDGGVDAGAMDAGTFDAGLLDGGVDAGLTDSGVVFDGGSLDAGSIDAGAFDAGMLDAGVIDAGPRDSGTPDAGVVDAGEAFAGCTVLPTTDRGSFASRVDVLLAPSGSAIGVTSDNDAVWSVLRTESGGTSVFDRCRLVFEEAGTPRALHANAEVTRGLLLATGAHVVMISADAGVLGDLNINAALVALSKGAGGSPVASIWHDTPGSYTQTQAVAPSLSGQNQLPPQSCAVGWDDVDVLPENQGGTIVASLHPTNCAVSAGAVTEGIAIGPSAQLITPSGARSGFALSPAYPGRIGPTNDGGFDIGYQIDSMQVGTNRRDADGGHVGYFTLQSSGIARLGAIHGGFVVITNSGSLNALFARSLTSTGPTAVLAELRTNRPLVTLGPTRLDAGVGLFVKPNIVWALWEREDGGVVLSTLR